MFNSVNLSAKPFSKPETAGTLAARPQAPSASIFSTETAGSVACSSAPAASSSFSVVA